MDQTDEFAASLLIVRQAASKRLDPLCMKRFGKPPHGDIMRLTEGCF